MSKAKLKQDPGVGRSVSSLPEAHGSVVVGLSEKLKRSVRSLP